MGQRRTELVVRLYSEADWLTDFQLDFSVKLNV